jgi:hypothetical protein
LAYPPVAGHITRLAAGVYLPPGGSFPLAVTDAEDQVLNAFLRRPAMPLDELQDQSGLEYAAKVLARLAKKYDGAFALAIRRPGARGRGGYAVLVADAPVDGPRVTAIH